MMTTLSETAPNLFRISTLVPQAGIQFNQFLIRDDERALRHPVLAIKDVGCWVEVPGSTARSAEDLQGAPDVLPSDEIQLGSPPITEGGQR